MTTKEFLIESLISLRKLGWVNYPSELLEPFKEVINESEALDLFDTFIKSKGYTDINDYNWEWCESHFDDGFYDNDIYKSVETFKAHIQGFADADVQDDDIPNKQ